MDIIKCVICAEGEIESGVYVFSNVSEYLAFSRGVEAGANCYAADSCFTVRPQEISRLEESGSITNVAAKRARELLGGE